MSFLRISAEHVNNKRKVYIFDKIFKCLNDDLINIFVRKFKFDCHELFEKIIKSFRVVYEVLFKSVQLLYDFNFFINHDFLSIRLKCLKNN